MRARIRLALPALAGTAVVLAPAADAAGGDVWAWGLDANGQLGSGTPDSVIQWTPPQPGGRNGAAVVARDAG